MKCLWPMLLIVLGGCSPIMEVTRPSPVDLSRFTIGENRIDVIAELGTATTNVPDGSQSCDMYKLYTRGPGLAGKAAIAVGEAAADVFTIGLAEILLTPTELATKN